MYRKEGCPPGGGGSGASVEGFAGPLATVLEAVAAGAVWAAVGGVVLAAGAAEGSGSVIGDMGIVTVAEAGGLCATCPSERGGGGAGGRPGGGGMGGTRGTPGGGGTGGRFDCVIEHFC